mmetsp:Transcript_1841/g.4140  ORF Transcript_1841/g.4140 Transcript_1841/m.4140 type:complete len:101 (+) Transcript_1841:44-346(+)
MQEAGGRLASVVCEPQYDTSGAYWAWKGGGDQLWDNYWDNSNRTEAFDNQTSKEGGDMLKAKLCYDVSAEAVGLKVFTPLKGATPRKGMSNPLAGMFGKK